MTVLKNYRKVEKSLFSVYSFLKSLDKKELSYRFQELDKFMNENSFTSTAWEDFKKALIFPEKLYVASQNAKNTGDFNPDIYLTIDASYFFNEDSLVYSKINHTDYADTSDRAGAVLYFLKNGSCIYGS